MQLRNGLLSYRIKTTIQNNSFFFLFSVSSWGTHLLSFSTFPICFKCWLIRIINVEFFGNFSGSCKRIGCDDYCPLVVVNFQWPATALLICKALVFFAELLEPPLHCMFISSSWATCVVDVASCLHCFMTHFELK